MCTISKLGTKYKNIFVQKLSVLNVNLSTIITKQNEKEKKIIYCKSLIGMEIFTKYS